MQIILNRKVSLWQDIPIYRVFIPKINWSEASKGEVSPSLIKAQLLGSYPTYQFSYVTFSHDCEETSWHKNENLHPAEQCEYFHSAAHSERLEITNRLKKKKSKLKTI